jgi:uncharacterized protein YciI
MKHFPLFYGRGSADWGLVFKVADRREVEDFARADPYVIHGVTAAWRVREWTTVTGSDALTTVTL